MLTYKGLPVPIISDYRSRAASRDYYADGVEFHIGQIEMVGNTGTYIDTPFHRYANGNDLSGLPLKSIADLPGIRITSGAGLAIDEKYFQGRDLANAAVLVRFPVLRRAGADQVIRQLSSARLRYCLAASLNQRAQCTTF